MTDNDAKRKKLSRRDFLKGSALAGAGLALSKYLVGGGNEPSSLAQAVTLTPALYLPHIAKQPTPAPTETATPTATPTRRPGTGPQVVHVHAASATNWNFGSDYYGYYVNQSAVNDMVDQGLMALTGTSSLTQAWQSLIPDYTHGQAIAVKVNLNNADCNYTDNQIDALIEPVNALIRSLVLAGIREEDVWVYDASRPMPETFYDRRQYTQARYIDAYEWCHGDTATFNHVDGSLRVSFSPSSLNDRWLPDLLYETSYLINMPLLKKHSISPVTLGFKNHFGSIDDVTGDGDGDNLHRYIKPTSGLYDSDYSPFVDIYRNANIAGKTVLTIGDGLFGASDAGEAPTRWSTFGNQSPNSLFFSGDPVAIDCVMCDFLRHEWGLRSGAYDYLFVAQTEGLGVCEGTSNEPGGDPWEQPYGNGYSDIQYVRIDL
jgi:hypothetical protein